MVNTKKIKIALVMALVITLFLLCGNAYADTADQYTKSLLHFEGPQFSTKIVDDTNRSWTVSGNAYLTTNEKKFGSSSLYLDGSSYIKTPASNDFAFGTGDFTISYWWKGQHKGTGTYNNHIGVGFVVPLTTEQWGTCTDPSGKVGYYQGGVVGPIVLSTVSVDDNQWHHIAVVRYNGTTTLYVDGKFQSSSTVSYNITTQSHDTYVGTIEYDMANRYSTGCFDEIHISNTARWTGEFSVLTATGGDGVVNLSWTPTSGAVGYSVYRATSPGGYSSAPLISLSSTSTTYTDTNVINGTTYYYIVKPIIGGGVGGPSNEAYATPQAPVPITGRALLRITMSNGFEKEYDLSTAEVTAFITWYDNRAAGLGKQTYTFNKPYNKGPFKSRKDSVVFDKILSYEIMEY